MGNSTFSFFLAAVLLSSFAAQVQVPPPHQVRLSSEEAETLLIHKEEPACKKDSDDGVKVMGTVVIAITIDKNGKVNHRHTLSGPKILRPLALETVNKYRYKPYLLNGNPVEVETTVSIPIDCFFHTGQA